MSNILNWPDYKVLQVSELEHDYQVHAEVSEPPTQCPHCNHPEIVGFGRRDEVIMDTPVHGRRTGIMLNRPIAASLAERRFWSLYRTKTKSGR